MKNKYDVSDNHYTEHVEYVNGVIVVKTSFVKGKGRLTKFAQNLVKPHIYFDKNAGKFSVNQVKSELVRSEFLIENARALAYISRLNKGLRDEN